MRSPRHGSSSVGRGTRDGGSAPSDLANVIALVMQLDECRTAAFERLEIPGEDPANMGRKPLLSYKNMLLKNNAQRILTIIWKESDHISSSEISRSGLQKDFPENSLTVYSLAVHICESPEDLASTNTYIRNTVIAAEAFGLVQRYHVSSKKIVISGTISLHNLMINIADGYNNILRQRLGINFATEYAS